MNNPLINTVFPKDILVFKNEEYDEVITFLVISQGGGKLNVVDLEDYHLQSYSCLYGDTLIEGIETDNEGFKFYKKGQLEMV